MNKTIQEVAQEVVTESNHKHEFTDLTGVSAYTNEAGSTVIQDIYECSGDCGKIEYRDRA